MKLILRSVTALICSVITVNLGISSGKTETIIKPLNEQKSLYKLVQSDSTLKPNNKQNGVKQSSQEIVGYWEKTNSHENKVNLLLQNNGRFVLIFTAPDGNWKSDTGNWSLAGDLLSLKDNDGSDVNTSSVTWISNNEFVSGNVKFRRTDLKANSLNQQLSGTWSIKKPQVGGMLSKTLINFQSDGKYYYQKTDTIPSLSIVDRQDVVVGNWEWQLGDYLYTKNSTAISVCRVYWLNNNEFICIHPNREKRAGNRQHFVRTNEQIKKPNLSRPLY